MKMKFLILIVVVFFLFFIAPISFLIYISESEKEDPVITEKFTVNNVEYRDLRNLELHEGVWSTYSFPAAKNYAVWRELENPTTALLIKFSENGTVFKSKTGHLSHMTTGTIWVSIEEGSENVQFAYIK